MDKSTVKEMFNQPIDYFAECHICHKEVVIPMTAIQYFVYQDRNRPTIQELFPDLSPELREVLVSNTCPKCWDKMFKTENEES